jgi:hypothetical protein
MICLIDVGFGTILNGGQILLMHNVGVGAGSNELPASGDDVGSHIVMIRHASSIVVLTHRRQIYDGKY